jgi:hypothetical protein
MNDDQRPWWASSTDGAGMSTDGAGMSTDGAGTSTDGAGTSTTGGRTSTEDPVEAHRAARRGAPPPGAAGDGDEASAAAGGGDHASAPAGESARSSGPSAGAQAPHSHADVVCGVCPICVLARTLGDSHPELLGHLTEAARHLAAAARAMLDTPGAHDPGTDRVQRIDLD